MRRFTHYHPFKVIWNDDKCTRQAYFSNLELACKVAVDRRGMLEDCRETSNKVPFSPQDCYQIMKELRRQKPIVVDPTNCEIKGSQYTPNGVK